MEIEPMLSRLWCDALPLELPTPMEQAGGEEAYTVLIFGTHYNTPGSDLAVTVALCYFIHNLYSTLLCKV